MTPRDALAVALADTESRWFSLPAAALGEHADRLLAALPDGWTLARREDAEDGAARDALALLIDAAETLHGSAISERLGLHRPIACDVVGECYVSEAVAAARKAKDALGGVG